MNIIIGENSAKNISDKYVVLELDTFRSKATGQILKSYCLIDKISLEDFFSLAQSIDLHGNVIENYKKKHWSYCLDSLDHLVGKWNKELDSFYDDLKLRIKNYQENDPGPSWDGIIDR